MIVKKELLKKLKDFGLNTYESKLWTALLSRGISTAGELSDIANVPRSRSYDVLESLEKKGFIIMKLGKPIKYIAVSPEEIVVRVKKRIEDETRSQLDVLDELNESAVLDELKLLHTQGVELIEPGDLTGIVKGRNNLYNHLEASMKQATKTVSVRHVTDNLLNITKEKNVNLDVLYVNCKLKKVADTEYRLIAELIRRLGGEVPSTGLPTEEVYRIFLHMIEKRDGLIILILDEIDQLINKIGDEILYSLTRINSELKNTQISIIGISNNLVFTDNLDPRVKSSLSEEEIVFPPYNALQLQDILNQRAKAAFKSTVIETGVIEKCAAYAAREHGDARRALELLRVAGEIAERNDEEKVKITHIDFAEDKIEKDRVLDVISTQPKQHQAILYSIMSINMKKPDESFFTGDIYELYKKICLDTHLRPLTQRRASDIISELDMLGIINGKIISKGRYGRTRKISLAIQKSTNTKAREILEKSLGYT